MPDAAIPPTPDELRRATFGEALRGYHPRPVDALLERAADDLAAGRPLDWLPASGSLRRCFRGYRRQDVDDLLDRLRRVAGPSTPTPSAAPTASTPPAPAASTRPAPPDEPARD